MSWRKLAEFVGWLRKENARWKAGVEVMRVIGYADGQETNIAGSFQFNLRQYNRKFADSTTPNRFSPGVAMSVLGGEGEVGWEKTEGLLMREIVMQV